MKKPLKITVFIAILLMLMLLGKQLWFPTHEEAFNQKDVLNVALSRSGNSYFIYRAQPAGFQYDLLNAYASYGNMRIRFVAVDSLVDRICLLESDSVDFVVLTDEECDRLYDREGISMSMTADTSLCYAWATRPTEQRLLQSINFFLSEYVKTSDYRMLRWKYVEAKTDISEIAKRNNQLSPYDGLIRKYSKVLDWDWRLLASLICQESRFRMDVSSGKGACGLMQLMPETARRFGFDDISDPETNIKAGVAYIKRLEQLLEKENLGKEEQIKFVLATYNAGVGRIDDCRKYTEQLEKDPNLWKNVAMVIPLLSKQEHYTSTTLSHGRFRGGNETLRFVDEVLERYYHYKNLLPD